MCHVIELKNCRITSSLNISEQATRCQNWLITNPTISIKHGFMRCQTGKTLTKWPLYYFSMLLLLSYCTFNTGRIQEKEGYNDDFNV